MNAGRIEVEQWITQPPERVWEALTTPALLARWWAAGDVRPVVGHQFALDMGPWGQQACEVLVVEPLKLLKYSFAVGMLDTTISWHLQAVSGGTRLVLVQEGLDTESPMGRQAFEGMGKGWPGVLGRMEAVVGELAS